MKCFFVSVVWFFVGCIIGLLCFDYFFYQDIKQDLNVAYNKVEEKKQEKIKLQDELKILKHRYDLLLKKYINLSNIECTITAYSPDKNQTDSTPYQTAIMEKPIPGWTVAVSWDLRYLLGRLIYIPELGIRRVNDLMNKRYKKRIDICVPDKDMALEFGKKQGDVVVIDWFLL